MKCTLCPKKPVADLRYDGRKLCESHFIQLVERRARRTISKYNLFTKNDLVAVAVSGGKDSITLLNYMKEFKKKMPLELHGIVIDEGIKGYRDSSIEIAKENFEELEIPYTIKSFKKEFGKSLDQIAKKQKLVCSYCGVFRRRLLNQAARELKANKIATGHNLDDELQSALMNYFRGDFARMARIGPKTEARKGFVQRVKPFYEVPEKEIGLYAILKGYKMHIEECPYAYTAMRGTIRDISNNLEEKHPGTKFQIMKGVEQLDGILKNSPKSAKLNKCKCGELTPAKICKACTLLKEI